MTNLERAKQFASGFDPLAGYKEAITEIQKVYVPHPELTEDRKAELNYILKALTAGTMVTVIYYKDGEYLKTTGMVAKIDCQGKNLTVVDRIVNIPDIYDIEIIP